MERGPRAPVSVFDDPTPEPFAGTVGGTPFTAADARALLFPSAARARGAAPAGALVIVLHGRACPPEGGRSPGGAHVVLSLSLLGSGAGGKVAVARRYDVGTPAQGSAAGLEAGAVLLAAGEARALAPASGWIEIEAVDAARVTGAAVLDFGEFGVLSGWFVAPRTALLARA